MIMTRDYSELIAQLCSIDLLHEKICVAIYDYVCGVWSAQSVQWYQVLYKELVMIA